MRRLIRAELLKIRRRSATYIIAAVAIVLMVLVLLLVGVFLRDADQIIEFPSAYSFINQFAFGLGGLLAVVYAAAYVGADWNWGVVRNVVARGEGRANYLLAKAVSLALVLAIFVVVMYVIGMAVLYLDGLVYNIGVASPLRARGLQDLFDNMVLGYPVLLERAMLGFSVAVILRSQLAGAVVGVVLFLGESIVRIGLTGLTLSTSVTNGGLGQNGLPLIGPEWYQFLPISVGDYVIGAAPGNGVTLGGGLEQFLLRPVPLEQAFVAVVIYLVAALLLAIVALNRQEIA